MGYESLSTVIVLVIVTIIIVVWLPVRTANGMKRVDEHRQDRYSPSLHIVEAENGERFGDIKPHKAKGAAMPASTPSARLTPEHIAHVRELRRASIRRRRMLAAGLLAVTVLVFVSAFPLKFSPWFALVPLALLAGVLALGANAARHARLWERRVSRYEHRRAAQKKTMNQARVEAAKIAQAHAQASDAIPQTSRNEASSDAATHNETPASGTSTEVMEQREIRRALRQAEQEQAKAKAMRKAAAGRSTTSDDDSALSDKSGETVAASMPTEAAEHRASNASGASSASDQGESAARAAVSAASLTVRDERDQAQSDATSELASVHPSRALDVFDMATSQDLISFTLGGEQHKGGQSGHAPESLEIKSTRQVSKATPAEPEVVERLVDEARAVKAADDAQASAAQAAESDDTANAASGTAVNIEAADGADRAAFHKTEEQADVDAPQAAADSLGMGLDSILARRGN
ncbi:hypothetical protein [Bifidobacterium scaligerum]|uniref:Uncharacterized protein n=1 Tax=Bifidobacterium scaligerum TaxID=2052656 RepID=A0A2M9HRQ0_9BIFI|nr:hypothetical protein [Bifidobacterium scaligerum]PJM79490.1 hypothetical protein CUU80_05650 [Bifidobacterium scaligerum]